MLCAKYSGRRRRDTIVAQLRTARRSLQQQQQRVFIERLTVETPSLLHRCSRTVPGNQPTLQAKRCIILIAELTVQHAMTFIQRQCHTI